LDPTAHPRRLLAKLESLFALAEAERRAIVDLPLQVTHLRADQDIVREGDRPTRSCTLLEGFAAMFKVTAEGKRQITAFHIPGDIPDLQSLHLEVLDTSLGTLTPCTVGFIQHEALHALCDRHPRIAKALWRETLVDAAIFREWTVNVGRREAYARIAHILCELMVRLQVVGLTQDHTAQIPITKRVRRCDRAVERSRQPGPAGAPQRWPHRPEGQHLPGGRLGQAQAGRRLRPNLSAPAPPAGGLRTAAGAPHRTGTTGPCRSSRGGTAFPCHLLNQLDVG